MHPRACALLVAALAAAGPNPSFAQPTRGAQEATPPPVIVEREDARQTQQRLRELLQQLPPAVGEVLQHRSLLWLAYAQGWSHQEIAATLGLKVASLKSLLHRARRRLAMLLANPGNTGDRS